MDPILSHRLLHRAARYGNNEAVSESQGRLNLPRLRAGAALLWSLPLFLLSLLLAPNAAAGPFDPPNTTIGSHPPAVTNSQTAQFTFASDPDQLFVTFRCKLDGGAFGPCPGAPPGNNASYSGLQEGTHAFSVVATNFFGDEDATPASYSWIIDRQPPAAPQLQSQPPNPSNSTAATFTYAGESGASLECSLDNATFTACPGGQSYPNLAPGSHQFSVRAKDLAGNLGPATTYGWVIDLQSPETTIDSGPGQQSDSADAVLNFHSTEPGSFQCRRDGIDWGGCASPAIYRDLAVGPHTFDVRAIDRAGNTDLSPSSWAWTVLEGATSASGEQQRRRRRNPSRVFVIVMENKEYGHVIGSRSAPFITRLARRYASATRFYAVAHPSLPNYLGMLGGSTFGINSGCTACDGIRARTIVDQLETNRIPWRAYMEGLPYTCYRNGHRGRYVKRHNPFVYFRRIATDRSCRNVVPGKWLHRDLRRDRLATFNWITPDQCHNTHDCGVRKGDRYLSRLIPKLLRHVGRHGFVILTYDEGTSSAGGGGRIPTIFAGPDVRRGARVSRRYNTYSVLKTLQRFFSLNYLGRAKKRNTRLMEEMFEDSRIRQPFG
jgi:hypothetical protein